MENIIEISCLEHIYPDKTKVELCGIDFTVDKGEKVALLGPNGSGKTTLIKHILGLLSPSKGRVRVFGVEPAKDFDNIRSRIGVVLQNIEQQLIGPTVLDDIVFSPLNIGYSEKKAIEMAEQIMEELEITHLRNKVIHYLSGGEKRKVALAGALVMNPELLVMDEPFSALDYKSQKELIALINRFSKEKQIGMVISTHDVELVPEFADTLYLISSKYNLSRKGTPREIFGLKDELKHYNLDEPNIVRLFNILKDAGIDAGSPIFVEEAAELLINKFNKQSCL